jgi:hypothetical protein
VHPFDLMSYFDGSGTCACLGDVSYFDGRRTLPVQLMLTILMASRQLADFR